MIGVRLMGGLGNQMFQYAAACALAHRLGTSVAIDLVFFENTADNDTPRSYELDCFNLAVKFISPAKRPIEDPLIYSGKKGLFRQISHQYTGKYWNIYREPHHNFDSKMLEQPDGTYLIGYWQTERYFADIGQKLLDCFTPKEKLSAENQSLLDRINKTESVSLHVRRGDYISNPNAAKFHGTKDANYYRAALKPILKQTKSPVLFVFSDDPAWCKQNLTFEQDTVYVDGNKKGVEDMRLMMNCKHNVIANSSFSWWAAWLNQNPDKIVVAPRQWFNDLSVNVSDVIPESWLKI